jgi:phage shock protein PspC (stress-responsive transcriptional regulator)
VRNVITVSLNGNAYQLEDDAYAALARYLEASGKALASNPDRSEIMADLEQAIADKCARHLNAHKSVVTRVEIEQVIAEMGPVDADVSAEAAGSGASAAPAQDPGEPHSATRRLYQISEGAIVSGICNGYAAYSGVDVTWIRVIFVLLIMLTGGLALLAYLVLMFVIPYANTSEEHAAARGLPFNARLLVEQAKQQYEQFAHARWNRADGSWRSEWRHARASWRLERRRAREQWRDYRRHYRRYGYAPAPAPSVPAPTPAGYVGHVITGTVLAILGLVLAVMLISMLLAAISLINTRAVLGWPLPMDIPLWVGLVGLIVLYKIIAWPIQAARHSAYWYTGNYHGPWIAAWDGLVGLAIVVALLWYGYHHLPQLRDFVDHLPRIWHDDSWSNTGTRV